LFNQQRANNIELPQQRTCIRQVSAAGISIRNDEKQSIDRRCDRQRVVCTEQRAEIA
jgi:hypothetical protein